MSKRRLRVYYRPGAHISDVPQMRIGGAWLSKAGFNTGDPIDLIVEDNRLVIRHAVDDDIPEMFEEAPGTVIPD